MEIYKNLDGESAIYAYQIGVDFIVVKFTSDKIYSYSYQKAGKPHVDDMKRLAINGSGLKAYINRHVKNLHD